MDPLVAAVIAAAASALGSFLVYRASRQNKRADHAQQMIDQQQEELAALRDRMSQLERHVRIQGDYVGRLRRHIADGHPPPPPPWPDSLIT